MQGLALNAVVVMIIAVVSLALLLTFFSGPFVQMLNDTFCFFNDNVLSAMGADIGRDVCPSDISCRGERIILESDNKQYVKSQLAARTLLCWGQKLPSCGDESICYEMILKKPLKEGLTEEELTQYLKSEGACNAIENSLVFDAVAEKPFPCGEEDLIIWLAKGNVIKDQSIVLIKYNIKNNLIVIDAGSAVKADNLVCQDAETKSRCSTLDSLRGTGYRVACCLQYSLCCSVTATTSTTTTTTTTTTTISGGTTTTVPGTCTSTCSALGYATGTCRLRAICIRSEFDAGRDGCPVSQACCCS